MRWWQCAEGDGGSRGGSVYASWSSHVTTAHALSVACLTSMCVCEGGAKEGQGRQQAEGSLLLSHMPCHYLRRAHAVSIWEGMQAGWRWQRGVCGVRHNERRDDDLVAGRQAGRR